MTPVEVYTMATTQFPRAPQFWKKLLSHHLNNGDMLACEEGFRKCLPKCRSVDLWDCYIAFMRKKTVEKDPPSSENYGNAKKLLETGFKKAVDSVGMCLDSSIIWRRYLDFVQSWPESTVHDSNSKLNELRAVYQRAICNPMDGLDTYDASTRFYRVFYCCDCGCLVLLGIGASTRLWRCGQASTTRTRCCPSSSPGSCTQRQCIRTGVGRSRSFSRIEWPRLPPWGDQWQRWSSWICGTSG